MTNIELIFVIFDVNWVMKRVVIITWKDREKPAFEVFSNLKLLSESYPDYNYNTLNNYLSKNKMPYENDKVRIERKMVHTTAIPKWEIVMVAKQVDMRKHDDEAADLAFWLSRPVRERIQAVTRLSVQFAEKRPARCKDMKDRSSEEESD